MGKSIENKDRIMLTKDDLAKLLAKAYEDGFNAGIETEKNILADLFTNYPAEPIVI
jgi:hypothetical protein